MFLLLLPTAYTSPHDSPQLLGSDGAVSVFVEQREGFLELGNLIFSELLCHLVGTGTVSGN